MTRKNITRSALVTSVISLLLCVSMLIGTTFAWFTDNAVSDRNNIQSGNLDAVLEYKIQNADGSWGDWGTVDEDTLLFKDGALYEPGYTEVVLLKVKNVGSLAFKYILSLSIVNEEGSVNVYGDDFWLSDYLKFGTLYEEEKTLAAADSDYAKTMFGSRAAALSNVELTTLSGLTLNEIKICDNEKILPGGEDTAQIIAMVLTMPTDVGNEANTRVGEELPWIELGVNLYASQVPHETDSFDDQYDANVEEPDVFEIVDATTFAEAFEKGGQGTIVNMDLTGVYGELAADKSLALNTNNSVIAKQDDKDYAIVNYGDLEITGDGTINTEFKGSIENWGKLYINNLNINVKGDTYGLHVKGGEAEINNLTLTAERGALNFRGGSTTVINSGSFSYSGYYNSSWKSGYMVYAVGVGTKVIINGGDFRYTGGNSGSQRVLCAQDGAVIEVYGGTFGKSGAKKKSSWLYEYDANPDDDIPAGTIIIYGGKFEFDPTGYGCLADGYQAVKGDDGWWTVSAVTSN